MLEDAIAALLEAFTRLLIGLTVLVGILVLASVLAKALS